MTAALVVLLGIAIVEMATIVYILAQHEDERARWATERKQLVDRAIARHAGEVIAFDRQAKPKPERDDTPPMYIEGLS